MSAPPADPHDLLREARVVAQRRGHTVTGWMLMEDDDGFAAWLYVEEGEDRPLFHHVEVQPTALLAAQQALAQAAALPVRQPTADG